MRQRIASVLVLGLALASLASAAPNVVNATQKGSLLVWPDIDVRRETLVRLENDGSSDVDVKCYWMDGNKNRVDFQFTLTRNQAAWFDARTGKGDPNVNPFPNTVANGFANPFLGGFAGPYGRGMLACFAVDQGGQNQVKWNHLSGTATVWSAFGGPAYEYSAYAFFAPTGNDLQPIGLAGNLNLNGVEYDSCPLYQIGQFSPFGANLVPGFPAAGTRLALSGCKLDLRQDWTAVYTKLQFDIWNGDEVKFTGAFECADSWHEAFFDFDIDAAQQNFDLATLATPTARYRVQGVSSTQCFPPDPAQIRFTLGGQDAVPTQATGVLAIQSNVLGFGDCTDCIGGTSSAGTNLSSAGKSNGWLQWDPAGAVPEGGVR